eukprot:2355948-Alexandrium_andersonii.AAC.1
MGSCPAAAESNLLQVAQSKTGQLAHEADAEKTRAIGATAETEDPATGVASPCGATAAKR